MSSTRMNSRKPKARQAAAYTPHTEPTPPLQPIVVPPSEEFTEAVYREIARLEKAREDAHRIPDYVLRIELSHHLSSALNELYKAGRIKVGLTINDKYITTKKELNYGTEKINQNDHTEG